MPRHREEEAAFLEQRNDALGKGTAWERVAELCDLQDSRSKTNTRATRDVSRMKELFLALKREGETAPGGQSNFFFSSGFALSRTHCLNVVSCRLLSHKSVKTTEQEMTPYLCNACLGICAMHFFTGL